MKFGTFEKRCSTEVKVETDDWLIDNSNVSHDISKEIQCTLRHNILIGCLELFNKESLYRINVVGQLMMIFLHFIAHLDQWLTNPQWNSGIHNSFENGSKCVKKEFLVSCAQCSCTTYQFWSQKVINSICYSIFEQKIEYIDVLQSFSTFAQSLSMRPKNGQYICFLLAQMTCGFFLTSILVRASFEQCNFNAQISENWRVLDKNWEFAIKSESFWFESRIQDERVSVKNHDFMTKT